MRKGFSLITAIVVMVLMAGITASVMNISGKVTKETSSQYRKEQSILLAKSYTEFAILAIQGHDMTNNRCLEGVNGVINNIIPGSPANANAGTGYRVNIHLQYIGLPAAIACPSNRVLDSASRSTTPNTSVLIDVSVRYRDIEFLDSKLEARAQEIHYNRRTLQRL